MIKWAYGVTTVPQRINTTFPRTIQSLKWAGFNRPTVFVDANRWAADYSRFNLTTVYRSHKVNAFGNWYLAMLELWIRFPRYDRYAIFQDDILLYKNLRQYLDSYAMYYNHYWNLYTFKQNEQLRDKEITRPHWYKSNQRGRGATALVFHRESLAALLSSPVFLAKPMCDKNPHKSIDGAIVNSFLSGKEQQYFEMVHHPTLTWHIGHSTAIGNPQHTKEEPEHWQGEDFDASTMIATKL